MKPPYRLLKLRSDTVARLMQLKNVTGHAELDGLINSMIRITNSYRHHLKNTGWKHYEIPNR